MEEPIPFHFETYTEGAASPWGMQKYCTRQRSPRPVGGRPSQLCHTPSCVSHVCRAEHTRTVRTSKRKTEFMSHILIHLSEPPHTADLEPHQRSLAAETSHGQ